MTFNNSITVHFYILPMPPFRISKQASPQALQPAGPAVVPDQPDLVPGPGSLSGRAQARGGQEGAVACTADVGKVKEFLQYYLLEIRKSRHIERIARQTISFLH